MPIGVIDSGVGGFSILAQLEHEFPAARFVYLSDTGHFPYSEKSVTELQTIGAAAVERLRALACNPIVIACNTLTVTALDFLRAHYPDTTCIGTVPAVKRAAEVLPPQAHVVVLATKNTAESEYLHKLVAPFQDKVTFTLLGSTELVTAIEHWNPVAITLELKKILTPILKEHPIDGVVLGCTHFSFVEEMIAQLVPNNTIFFDPLDGIAKQVARFSELFLNPNSSENFHLQPPVKFLATDQTPPEKLAETYATLKKKLLD